MPNYRSPGIYVEEVSSGASPIESVGTSTAGFVGTAPNAAARPNEAVAINNWTEFKRVFTVENDTTSTPLSRAVYGFFDNGGGRCYIVNIPSGEPLLGKGKQRSGLRLLEEIDEVAMVAAPGYTDPVSYEALLSHCEDMGDRLAILDGPEHVNDAEQLTRVGSAPQPKSSTAKKAEGDTATAPAQEANPGLRPRQSDYGTFYFPWIAVSDPITGEIVNTPPSGHMAGVWARTDSVRGVHKAPANEPIRGAVNLSYRVTKVEQDLLNPNGVNCIRYFPAEGIRVWGARTLAAGASEWRYLNVRRLFNMLKESIADGTRWIVFEPNDNMLWKSIRRDVSAFLTLVWRDGALQGRTPQEAFFVKCDEETNPVEVRDAGQVVTIIGVAPVKPAEFVVFRISQSAGVTGADQAGA